MPSGGFCARRFDRANGPNAPSILSPFATIKTPPHTTDGTCFCFLGLGFVFPRRSIRLQRLWREQQQRGVKCAASSRRRSRLLDETRPLVPILKRRTSSSQWATPNLNRTARRSLYFPLACPHPSPWTPPQTPCIRRGDRLAMGAAQRACTSFLRRAFVGLDHDHGRHSIIERYRLYSLEQFRFHIKKDINTAQ